MKRPNPKAEQKAVDTFNKHNPVGTFVDVRKDDGSHIQTPTESEAWLMGGHSAVIKLKGISGAYSLHRVTPVYA